jgi:hypothetical protein
LRHCQPKAARHESQLGLTSLERLVSSDEGT